MDEVALNCIRQLDRANLGVLLGAANGASNALKRDVCGDPVIAGSRGAVRSCNGKFSVYIGCRSRRHWTAVKKALAGFCTVTQDGDDVGILRLDRLPVGEEAARLREAIGLRQTRTVPSAAADRLAPFRFSTPVQGQLDADHAPEADGGCTTASDAAEAINPPELALERRTDRETAE
jgi:hypothetical protein